MINNEFDDLVILFCSCIMDENVNNADYLKLTDKDLIFCEKYASLYDVGYFNTKKFNISDLNILVQKHTNEYCKNKFLNKETPFDFFDEISINTHINEIEKFCLKEKNNINLHSVFKITILNLILLECYSFKNTSQQIMRQIDAYHTIKDALQEKQMCEYVELFDKLNKQITNSIQTLNDTSKNTTKKVKSLERKIYENSITILGIFSAAVLAFNVATGFYSSILESFSHASIYKILLIILIIGIIIVGTMMGLFYYLEKIRVGSSFLKTKDSINKTNTQRYDSNNNQIENVSFKEEQAKTFKKLSFFSNNRLKSLYPFIITMGIIIVLIIGVLFSWRLYVVENRNSKYITSMSSETTNSHTSFDVELTTVFSETETEESSRPKK